MKKPRTQPSAPPRLWSRRRPRLRLVGAEPSAPRHAVAIPGQYGPVVAEVLTFAEYEDLPGHERPETFHTLPGLGFLVIRPPIGPHELEDLKDVSDQAHAEWCEARGLWTD